MVATSRQLQPVQPWFLRWNLPVLVPGGLLAAIMLWSVTRSIAASNWAEGLNILTLVALPALLVGIIFAQLTWLPGWLAHLLSAALGLAWAVQCSGALLIREVGRELGAPLGARLVSWGDWASEILIRILSWLRILQAGGRGEDIVLFVVALALLSWALGYATGWLLFRRGWAWRAVVLNALTILVNYTFASPKPNQLFFIFLGSALLVIVHQNVVRHQQSWQASEIDYPEFMSWRFLGAAALFCSLVVVFTSLLPSTISSGQVARAWRTISLPLTVAREGWEQAFSTINAPAGSGGGNFANGAIRAGGPRSLGDTEVLRVRSSEYDYWRAVAKDRYTGQGWDNTVGERARSALGFSTEVQARSPIAAGVVVPRADLAGRTLITQTIELVGPSSHDLLIFGGEFSSSTVAAEVQNGVLFANSGNTVPNFDETAAVFAESSLQPTSVYTVSTYISTVDEQSLRLAGDSYPDWVKTYYIQLPDSVTDRTRERARQIVQQAGAINPYDQARAIQSYLRTLTYDETRAQPPENRDWADYFLFSTQRGYCDDFATAMIVLLRSLNVPARLAQGYAGGALDPQLGSYVVRESIGHSWPEVYFPGYGWQRFEPTPASYASVPTRPALPSTDTVEPGQTPGSPGLSQQDAEERLRRLLEEERLDALANAPADIEALRRAQAERIASERNRQLLILGGILAAILGGAGLFVLKLQRDLRGLSPAAAAYAKLTRMAGWAGLPHDEHRTPSEYGRELSAQLPEQQPAIGRIISAYISERYSPSHRTAAADLERDWLALRKPLLARMLSRIGAAARPQPGGPAARRRSLRNTNNPK